MHNGTFKSLLDKVMQETDQYTTVSFAGIGEPLKDGGLETKIEYIKKKYPHVNVPIVTNGSLMNIDRFLNLQKAGVDIIRISFHGGTQESYRKIHKVNDFYKVLDRINMIIDKKLNTKTKLAITLATIKGINDDSIEIWKKLWVDKVWLTEIWRAHNWTDAFDFREIQKERRVTCGRVFKAPLQIQVDGTVNMCCFDYDGKLVIGDLKTQSLKEIFSNKAFKKIAECHTTGNFENSKLICENCDQRNIDKIEALIFSSRFKNKEDRIMKSSTAYKPIL